MAISREALIEELCGLSDEVLEKLLEKFENRRSGSNLGTGAAGGAAVGAFLGGPVGAAVGVVAGGLYGMALGGHCDNKWTKQVRESVANRNKLTLPDQFCTWAEEQKKKKEWLKFEDPESSAGVKPDGECETGDKTSEA